MSAAAPTAAGSASPDARSQNLPDLMAGLWQEAPFARLPDDAPPELHDLVHDIDNPRRVYAIHRATRRHDFQLLVERYIHQLRNGCGSPHCTTATCFTCRVRLAGKSPIRRYSPTSARTLAVYLASQNEPDRGICPYLGRPDDPPQVVNNLIFSARKPSLTDGSPLKNAGGSRDTRKDAQHRPKSPRRQHSGDGARRKAADSHGHAKVQVTEKPVNRDYRSFAATTFSTVAFKMLEWLTPHGVESISAKAADAANHETETKITIREDASPDRVKDAASPQPAPQEAPARKRVTKSSIKASAPKTQRKGSFDSIMPTETAQAKPAGYAGDKKPRAKMNAVARGVPEIPIKSPFFQNVPCLSPPIIEDVEVGLSERSQSDEDNSTDHDIAGNGAQPPMATVKQDSSSEAESWIDYPLPQALDRLDLDIVDFICDTYLEDRTEERHFFGPLTLNESHPKPQNKAKRLRRRSGIKPSVSPKQWRAFNEQTLFNVLSDPKSLVSSFTAGEKLYDSQTLWYCMLRMTRATPSLVFHSLWLAAKSLFLPPASLNGTGLPARKLFGRNLPPAVSDYEAGCIMSICLHALVAAAPCAPDSKTLYEMSRVRSNGQVLGGKGGAARQPAAVCLEYDDVLSNDLALRLARRLLRAITARRCFAEIAETDMDPASTAGEDVLGPLLGQLDLLGSSHVRLLEFSQAERLLHETRVPTLLLDWARAVLLQDWDGRPDYGNESAFHGAMSLMATLYENKNMLLLGDVQFRVDYFSERLDSMEVPVAWIAFTPSRQKHHILDHPYLFSPDTLVSFFRSINFSRMSRTFEESSSLKTRMTAIVDPGSLVTNTHHKHVLQDLLRTASSRYLVLEISRSHVLRDAFDQLWRRQERELLRPLKVHLGENSGEEGFDSGGVQQEFFRMAIAECLDPKYGAFTVDDRTRMVWFVPGSVVELWKFEMIGLLFSLALYNGLTLPITFPKAFYRKLLGQPVAELYHIADGWPELASGLTTLQEWDEKDGAVEDVFARTYEFSVSAFGNDVTVPMTKDADASWPQGIPAPPARTSLAAAALDDAPLVTNDNRDEYVSDYVRYLTDVSIRPQFLAFERGFRSCLEPKSLTLLTPVTLQPLVEGVQEIDISELRRCARYVGWDTSHHTVKDFWSIVKRYDADMKRKLLEFVTASDRVPVGGMRNLQFVLQKNGEEGEGGHLPTAYTCYGTLLLPEYKDREVLRERLGMALENAQGFGFA